MTLHTHLLTAGMLLACATATIQAQTLWFSPASFSYTYDSITSFRTKWDDTIAGGHDATGNPRYICQGKGGSDAFHTVPANGLMPGFSQVNSGCWVGWGGKAYELRDYNVLVMTWLKRSGDFQEVGLQGGHEAPTS